MTNAKELEQRVRDHLALFNNREWDKYKNQLSDDCVYDEEATQRKITGPERIVETLKAWTTAFPDLKGTVRDVFVAGDKAVCEVLWQGTHKGSLSLPLGNIPATGRRGEIHAMEKIELGGDGKITSMLHVFDSMALLAQLGMKPQIGPQAGAR